MVTELLNHHMAVLEPRKRVQYFRLDELCGCKTFEKFYEKLWWKDSDSLDSSEARCIASRNSARKWAFGEVPMCKGALLLAVGQAELMSLHAHFDTSETA